MRRLMDVNFGGTMNTTKYALPYILKNKGSIVAVSSIAGYRGLPGRAGYSASKFAVNGFMEALRTELLDTGVNVLWVCPGFTASNIRNVALNKDGKPQGESPLEEKKLMPASVCANYIIRAIEKRKRTIVLTANGKETVFLNKFFPSLTDRIVKMFFYKKGVLVK
jgi:short-subunit dehydrogenase